MEQLFGAIPSVLGGLGPHAETDEAVIFAVWTRCAGELLRARTAPVEFFENRLVVAVEDETWRRHLEDLSPQMLVRINGILGQRTVGFIEFRIDERAVKKIRGGKKQRAATAAPAKVTPALASAAEAISDEGLRERFLETAATYLARQGKHKSEKGKK